MPLPLKHIFLGTPEFAAIVLEKLIAAHMPPVLVVCNPDRPVGRKQIVTHPPTKVIAIRNNIEVWQPEKLEIGNWKLEIDKLGGAEFAIVAAYSKILPKEIIDSLKNKFIGVHPSLLPRHRGTTPIQTAILNGDEKTGVTLYLLDEKIDHGPVLAMRELTMTNDDNYDRLNRKLAELGASLLIETLPKFVNGEIKSQPQDEAQATYTKKFKTEDAYVNLDKDDPAIVERKIRALNPEPGPWTTRNGKRVKLLEAELVGNELKLRKIQIEGKKPQVI